MRANILSVDQIEHLPQPMVDWACTLLLRTDAPWRPLDLAPERSWVDSLWIVGVLKLTSQGFILTHHGREALFSWVYPHWSAENLRQAVLYWVAAAQKSGNQENLADAYDALSNIAVLDDDEPAVVEALAQSLNLHLRMGNYKAGAARAWSIGAFLAQRGERRGAIRYLKQAICLAAEHDFPHLAIYRDRLRAVERDALD